MNTNFDVIIVGAGLSGIAAAYHLQTKCPTKKFTILEARENMGGTWDLFKYPGIRSDSDMYTLGYSFKPWKNPKAIADGPSILSYIKETASEFGIDKHIQYNNKVIAANWSSNKNKWEINTNALGEIKHFTCDFFFACSGYYNYNEGYLPEFKGYDLFKGQTVHPQKWTNDIDYKNKEVVVIGSGATAVTLVPELSKQASKVTMLQRSPTYILNLPSEDKVANTMKKFLPSKVAHHLIRWKNILFSLFFYKASRKWPNSIKKYIKKGVIKQLGEDYNISHFEPKYNPWDQRLCLVPDSDLFQAIKSEKAEIVTDHIDTFTKNGILLKSGKELNADLIVTATGLQIQLFGGMTLSIDNNPVDISKLHCYRGVMFEDIPNFGIAIGYTNASWTLKCDLNCAYICRIINYLDKHNYNTCTPKFDTSKYDSEPLLDFNAGYVLRALDVLPKQGTKLPWKVYQNYILDLSTLKYSKINDDVLLFQ